ncbi:hypothetical protein SARC_00115 [Sphaeroforma arctica JP610]|uniref:Thioredoxin domain-containing protein n=1 Tax=Sphaeroforma arctica JP610 TaxID=667725 RepID=A0A0L0GHN5_9EUKA|nr:hypothetical protein SARC_00115 [Sphaeroforma arctica JP610]KNC87858.1 hypothetical protein SARC_00115 [Sphaeroforma arctica JP610]|eukprot:XP_014161760.1 hypothetical protein SARC_00115 [Sphaeroforma arctica JP610]
MYKKIGDVRNAPEPVRNDERRNAMYDMQDNQRQHTQEGQYQYHNVQQQKVHHDMTGGSAAPYAPNDTLFQDTGDYSEFEKYLPKELRGGKIVRMTEAERTQYGVNDRTTPMAAGDRRVNGGVSIRALDMTADPSTTVPYTSQPSTTHHPSRPNTNKYPTPDGGQHPNTYSGPSYSNPQYSTSQGGLNYATQDPSTLTNTPQIATNGPFLMLETHEQLAAVLSSHKVVVVTHTMDGCSACATFLPGLEQVALTQTERYGDNVRFALVNAKYQDLNQDIVAFPTTRIYLSGNVLREYKGAGYAKKISKVVSDAVYV